jgi:hypothetical protein
VETQSVQRSIPRGLVLLGVLCQAAIVGQPRATADDDESGVSQVDVGLPRVIVRGGGHFPVVIRLCSGELAAVMRGHYEHVLGDASLDIVRSADEGTTWSAPRTAIDAKNVDDRNPAFGQLADGTLVLAFARYDMAQSRSTGVWSARSADMGRADAGFSTANRRRFPLWQDRRAARWGGALVDLFVRRLAARAGGGRRSRTGMAAAVER